MHNNDLNECCSKVDVFFSEFLLCCVVLCWLGCVCFLLLCLFLVSGIVGCSVVFFSHHSLCSLLLLFV
jgi:hypothetical protein